jgi:rod shape-determining protein MreC
VQTKQVRRRRAVLGLLVAVSLILLTAYFGESSSSPLHTVQRGIVEVFSPIQEGASKVLTPVRDIAGWFSGTIHAKSRADQLQTQVDTLRAEVAQLKSAAIENQQLTQLVRLDNRYGIDSYHPVSAQVISRDPILWYETVEVDKGSEDGVHLNDPVIGDNSLVGDVTTVDPTVSIVTLITDHSFAAAAQVEDSAGDSGLLVPAVGNPNQMILQDLPEHASIQAGDQVVTAGFTFDQLDSLYPPGIPIGQVAPSFSQDELLNNGQVPVSLVSDLRHISVVQILTTPHAGTERAQLP